MPRDYYAKSRCDVLLKHIAVPTLIVSANNDPLVPAHLLPHAADVSDAVTLEITRGRRTSRICQRPLALVNKVLVGDEDTGVSGPALFAGRCELGVAVAFNQPSPPATFPQGEERRRPSMGPQRGSDRPARHGGQDRCRPRR